MWGSAAYNLFFPLASFQLPGKPAISLFFRASGFQRAGPQSISRIIWKSEWFLHTSLRSWLPSCDEQAAKCTANLQPPFGSLFGYLSFSSSDTEASSFLLSWPIFYIVYSQPTEALLPEGAVAVATTLPVPPLPDPVPTSHTPGTSWASALHVSPVYAGLVFDFLFLKEAHLSLTIYEHFQCPWTELGGLEDRVILGFPWASLVFFSGKWTNQFTCLPPLNTSPTATGVMNINKMDSNEAQEVSNAKIIFAIPKPIPGTTA